MREDQRGGSVGFHSAAAPWLGLALCLGCGTGRLRTEAWRAQVLGLDAGDETSAFAAVRELEALGEPAAGPWLLALQRDPTKHIALRCRAAAALLELGYATGQEFCLAVLAANLPGSRASDAEHALGQSERWAFPREIAASALARRLESAGRPVPPSDPNLGAADLRRSALAFAQALAALPALRPDARPAALEASIPSAAPPGFAEPRWKTLREACIDAARGAKR